jgi:hypothetical protein
MKLVGLAVLSLALVAPPLACNAMIGLRTRPPMERHRVQAIYDYNYGDPAYLGYFWPHHPCAHHHRITDRQGGPWQGDPATEKPPAGTPDSTPRCPVPTPPAAKH